MMNFTGAPEALYRKISPRSSSGFTHLVFTAIPRSESVISCAVMLTPCPPLQQAMDSQKTRLTGQCRHTLLQLFVAVAAQQSSAPVANTLQNLVHDILKANVEQRFRKLDVPEVARTRRPILPARLTGVVIRDRTQSRVEESTTHWEPVLLRHWSRDPCHRRCPQLVWVEQAELYRINHE